MLTFSFAFAVLCFIFLILFFSGLPDLRICNLPYTKSEAEPDRHKNRLAVLIITIIYSLLTFWHLGNLQSPQSFVPMESNRFQISLPKSDTFRLAIFPGVGQGEYSIEYSKDQEGWFPITSFTQDHVAVLKWQFLSLDLPSHAEYLRVICTSGAPWLGEVQLQTATGHPLNTICTISELVDEQDCVPDSSDYMNSSYFDEIYHARTAWEHLNQIWPYEISHPPLGKEILSLGILLFGMTPFGWRFSGALTGIFMIPVMFLFLRRLFGQGRVAVMGTIIFAAGFMHYVQTRIATIDSYAVFFILLMYYFMLGWSRNGNTRELVFCGLCFGLGAACKWTCLYAGAGLAVIWTIYWVSSFKQNITLTAKRFVQNILLCIFLFVLIPVMIYYISYTPYGMARNIPIFSEDYTNMILDNQRFMFQYHSSIVAEHPYSSRWYQWIFDIRPILYYLEYFSDGTRESIAAFVNPMICWGGFLSILVLLYCAIKRREKTALFLLIAYFSGLIPWFFISRLTFEYHYFASAVFLVPAICYIFQLLENNSRMAKYYIFGFSACTVILFFAFFPVLNGIPVDNDLTSRLLGWLPSWPI